MKIKVAIIDPTGSHGSSHHYYLFAQAKGLKQKLALIIFFIFIFLTLTF